MSPSIKKLRIDALVDEIEGIIRESEEEDCWTQQRLDAERKGLKLFHGLAKNLNRWHVDERGRFHHRREKPVMFHPADTMRAALELHDHHLILQVDGQNVCVEAHGMIENIPMTDHLCSMLLLGEAGFPFEQTPETMYGLFSTEEILAPLDDESLDMEARCKAAQMVIQMLDSSDEEDRAWYTETVNGLDRRIRDRDFPSMVLTQLLLCSTLRENWLSWALFGHEESVTHLMDVASMIGLSSFEGALLRGPVASSFQRRMGELSEGHRTLVLATLDELTYAEDDQLRQFVEMVLMRHHASRVEAEEVRPWDEWDEVDDRLHMPPAQWFRIEEPLDIMDF